MIAPGVVKTYPLVTADQASSHAPEAATPSIAAVGHERIDAAWHDVKPQQNETLTDRPSEDWAVTASADVLTAPEPRDFRQRLDDLNLALSRTVLADVDRWELAPLRTQAEELRERSQSSEERFSVESLLQKINEFQSLQSRRRQLSLAGSSRESLAEPGRLPSFSADAAVAPTAPEMPRRVESAEVRAASAETAAPPETMPAVGPMVDDDIFDASGLLISVVSRKAGLPRFALTDPQGRVLHFVTPAEGIDLRQFVGRRVGVIGRPGYIRQYRKPHVTARRVVLLQR
jgi:hypothetical protein